MAKFPLLLLLAVLSFSSVRAEPVKAQHPYVAYAQLLEDTSVTLSDDSVWEMDKGDCFPIYMYKDHQTRVVLQLGNATFATESARIRVMKESEVEVAKASYRKNMEEYLKSKTEHWKREAK